MSDKQAGTKQTEKSERSISRNPISENSLLENSISENFSSNDFPDLADTEFADLLHEGRQQYDMDIDRMVNEGLGGGQVTVHNGRIGASTTDTMNEEGGL